MSNLFSEEDIYDMGFEPLEIEDGERLSATYKLYLDNRGNFSEFKGAQMAIYPVLGNTIPFPFQILQLEAVSPMELAMARGAYNDGGMLFLGVAGDNCLAPDPNIPSPERICEYGVVAKIIDFKSITDNGSALITVLTGIKGRINMEKTALIDHQHPFEAFVDKVKTTFRSSAKFELLLKELRIHFETLVKMTGNRHAQMLLDMMGIIKEPQILLYFLAMHLPVSREEKYRLLEEGSLITMAENAISLADNAIGDILVRRDVMGKVHEQMSQQQRENHLRIQMQAIKGELGENYEENADIAELQQRGAEKKWNAEVARHFAKELQKMSRFNVAMPEYSIQYTYLDMLLNLPWENYSEADFTLDQVLETLDEDHYGLEKVKKRIVEHMAVHKLRGDMKAPILCLAGAPGVGKTSLGKSIARALGRDYHRIALGGVSDEAEVRGHRRTYIGAMAGRIMSALAKCGHGNPVILLDEIDKIGKGLKGDPSQALLEVLDPEQNVAFHDNYVDVDYDLSKVFFIATANDLSEVPGPLLDRMEVIEISGYVTEEKIEIALRHLVPRSLLKNGFSKGEVSFTREAVKCLIESYTRESGVRQLEKKISAVLRKLACLKADGKDFTKTITEETVRELLGKESVSREMYEGNDYSGVVTGLAWTAAGGEILFIETSVSEGKGDKLTLTGNLGTVMKESATIALEYLKSHPEKIGMTVKDIATRDIHLHVPEGAVPKDGPSAGITMTVSIASALTGRKVRNKLAMTGEMTLRGKVLPVGGIKEKILAARRAGITDIMLCSINRKDVEEIPERYLDGLTFHYVDHIDEVLAFALLDEKANI